MNNTHKTADQYKSEIVAKLNQQSVQVLVDNIAALLVENEQLRAEVARLTPHSESPPAVSAP